MVIIKNKHRLSERRWEFISNEIIIVELEP